MARKPQDDPKLDMTPMIDVVFELIIFFVVTIKQEDILSKLNVNRPATNNAISSQQNDDEEKCEIQIATNRHRPDRRHDGVYVIGDAQSTQRREVELPDVKEYLKKSIQRRAGRQKVAEIPVIVKASEASHHGALTDLLDLCYELGLRNINVFTL